MLIHILFTLGLAAQQNIWLDLDTGDSQALAIIFGAYNFKILGISSVHGSHSSYQAAQNALKVTTNIQMPYQIGVIQGQELPMNNHSCIKSYDEGMYLATAFSDHQIPISSRDLTKELNVQIEYRSKQQKFTLLLLGAATNFAKLLKQYPERIPQIAEIVIVGGNLDGCDQNIHCDSDALQMLMEVAEIHKIKITFIPQNLQVPIPKQFIDSLTAIDKRLSKWILGMVSQDNFSLHKLLGIYYILQKEEFEIKSFGLSIERFQDCFGQTKFYESENQNIQVATNLKTDKLFPSLINMVLKAQKGALINI